MAFDTERRARLGRGMKACRTKAGLTRADASSMISVAGIRCSPATLMAWERGRGGGSREPFASDLVMIAGVYHCRIDELCGYSSAESSDRAEFNATLVG